MHAPLWQKGEEEYLLVVLCVLVVTGVGQLDLAGWVLEALGPVLQLQAVLAALVLKRPPLPGHLKSGDQILRLGISMAENQMAIAS